MRCNGLWLVALALTDVGAARAAERPKLAVMPLAAVRGVEGAVARMLTTTLTTRLARAGAYQVMSADEAEALLGLEKLKDALGCEDATCAAEIGGALGSDLMLTGSVGKLGSKITVSLALFDVREVKVVARAQQSRPDDEDEYDGALQAAVDELLAAAGVPSGEVAVFGILRTDGITGLSLRSMDEPEPVVEGDGGRFAGQVTTAVGGTLVAFGALATFLSIDAANSYEQTWAAADARRSRTWAATMVTAYATGAAVAAVGLLLWLGAPEVHADGPAPVALLTRGGLSFGWQGAF